MPNKIIYIAIDEHNSEPSSRDYLPSLEEERESIVDIFRQKRLFENGIDYKAEKKDSWEEVVLDINIYAKSLFIFHFAGHANTHTLNIADTSIEGKVITNLLNSASPTPFLKLVFLNACSTRDIAKTFLEKKKDVAIIATYRKINDTKAKKFAENFYRFLVQGNTIQQAYESAISILGEYPQKYIFRGLGTDKTDEETELDNKDIWGLFCNDDSTLNWKITNIQPYDAKSDALINNYWYRCDREEAIFDFYLPQKKKNTNKVFHFIVDSHEEHLPDMIPKRVIIENRIKKSTFNAGNEERDRNLRSFLPGIDSFYEEDPEISYQLFLETFSSYIKYDDIKASNLLQSPLLKEMDFIVFDFVIDKNICKSATFTELIKRFCKEFSNDNIAGLAESQIKKMFFFWRTQYSSDPIIEERVPKEEILIITLRDVGQDQLKRWLAGIINQVYDISIDLDVIEKQYYAKYPSNSYKMKEVRDVFVSEIKPKLVEYLNNKIIN